ncbi:hypothetical protein HYFRA_00010262 [Hymenoscyphus fraxineus]|uniref:Uncharacterized protein n=1 Tax=Hymenoscyphus fraxineus TaxID=746836 RepID=A0A9N9KZ38_9HELO|nr:hypothetical protein HYFRA_00010262 [Hymenoscyphus fraxineus]
MRSELISKALAIVFLVAAPLASAQPVKAGGVQLSARDLISYLNFARSVFSDEAGAESPIENDAYGEVESGDEEDSVVVKRETPAADDAYGNVESDDEEDDEDSD